MFLLHYTDSDSDDVAYHKDYYKKIIYVDIRAVHVVVDHNY